MEPAGSRLKDSEPSSARGRDGARGKKEATRRRQRPGEEWVSSICKSSWRTRRLGPSPGMLIL